MLVPDITSATAGTSPDSHSNNGSHTHDDLDIEQPSHLVWWDHQNRKLDDPNQEVGYHLLGGDASRLRERVWQCPERRPDRSDHLNHGAHGEEVGDGVPEERGDQPNHDGELGQVVPEGRASQNRKWRMSLCTSVTIESHRHAHDKGAKDDSEDSLTPKMGGKGQFFVLGCVMQSFDLPCQSNGENGTAGLPALNTDDIAEPITKDGHARPCSTFDRGNVQINVGPRARRSPTGLLFLQHPSLKVSLLLQVFFVLGHVKGRHFAGR